jgi:hypothetical protein
MISVDRESFLTVVAVAAIAAFVAGLIAPRLAVPVVVLEIVMRPSTAASLVDAAILSTTIFPLVRLRLRASLASDSKTDPPPQKRVWAPYTTL